MLLYLFLKCLIVFPSFALEKSLLFGMGSYRSRWEVTCTHQGKRNVTLYSSSFPTSIKLSTSKTINMNEFAELQLQKRSESFLALRVIYAVSHQENLMRPNNFVIHRSAGRLRPCVCVLYLARGPIRYTASKYLIIKNAASV